MATTKLWTVEELEHAPPDGRYELIDGELVEMTPSGRRAAKTGVRIGNRLSNHVEPRGLGEVTGADGGFVLFPERRIVRVPDVAFVRADRLTEQDEEGFYRLAPDLAVEVLSPTDRMDAVLAKVEMYLEAGVCLVWLVDPRARTVTIHELDRSPVVLQDGDELDGGAVLPGFRVTVAELFA